MKETLLPILLGAAGGAAVALLLLQLLPRNPALVEPDTGLLHRVDALVDRVDALTRLLAERPLGAPAAVEHAPVRREAVHPPEEERIEALVGRLATLVAGGTGSHPMSVAPAAWERTAEPRWDAIGELARRLEADEPATRRDLNLRTSAEILDRFGFPDEVFANGNVIQYLYHREGRPSAWFNFCDGVLVAFHADDP